MLYPWHVHLWQQVLGYWQLKRPPHALLLSGPAGLGKIDFAYHLAQLKLCQNITPETASCGTCRSCQLFQSGTHPDFIICRPESERSIITIDQIREMTQALSQTTYTQGGAHVVVIEPAHAMNIMAANALLKTLEEPLGDAMVLLIAPQQANIPATVRSRCQYLVFQPPTTQQALAWLAPHIPDESDARAALLWAGQGPLLAKAMYTAGQIADFQAIIQKMVQLVQQPFAVCQVAQALLTYPLQDVLQCFMLASWQALKWQACPSMREESRHVSPDLQTLARQCSDKVLFALWDKSQQRYHQCLAVPGLNGQSILEQLLSVLAGLE